MMWHHPKQAWRAVKAELAPLFRLLLRLQRDRSGAIATLVAVSSVALMGFFGLGTEAVIWYSTKEKMQTAADTAATSAVVAELAGNAANIKTEAQSIAAMNGFANGLNGANVAVNIPPSSGSHQGDPAAVEVVITQPPPLLFSTKFLPGAVQSTFQIAARSVATVIQQPSQVCILALDPHASGALNLINNAKVLDPKCGVAANSDNTSAMTLSENVVIDGPISVHGGWSLSNGDQLNGSPNLQHAPPFADPYANVQRQNLPACTQQDASGGNTMTVNLEPGLFCNGWNFKNKTTINLDQGTYYIEQQLVLGNNATIQPMHTGDQVTLVIVGDFALSIGNNATVNITAPTTGPYAGLAIFGDRNGASGVVQDLSNNTDFNINGAIYFPNQIISFDNNFVTANTQNCTQIIGRMIQLSNNVEIHDNCKGTGVIPIDFGGSIALVE